MQRLTLLMILVVALLLAHGTGDAAERTTNDDVIHQAEMEQILAPIALYPDVVLSHILIAATYPLEVVQAQRWTANNPNLKGSDAVQAVDDQDWDASVRALVAFPLILKRMSDDLDWTQRLGEAFLQGEERLLASVQSLRQLAYKAGSLDDMEKVSIIRDDTSIVIEPVEREIVYVPYYNSRTVYGSWPWVDHVPVYWDYPYNDRFGGDHYRSDSYADNHHRTDRHHRRSFYWGPRTRLSFGFFFNTFHWRDRYLARIPYQYYRPHQYYNYRQITRHHRARRWEHDLRHRRGVHYRSSHLRRHDRNRDLSNRQIVDRVRNRVSRQQEVLINRQANRARQAENLSRRARVGNPTVIPNDFDQSEDYQRQSAARRSVQERIRRATRNQSPAAQPRQQVERNAPRANQNAQAPRRATPREQATRLRLPAQTVRTQRQQSAPAKTQRRASNSPKPTRQAAPRQRVETSASRARESVKSSVRDRLRKPN